MNWLLKKRSHSGNIYYCPRPSNIVVDEGLSVSPADVARLTAQGVPVSSSNVGTFIDGVENPSFDLPIDKCVGVDIADCWEASMSASRRLSKAQQQDISNYGR